jgi:very-short-patch-repair endonuclease
LSQPDSQNDVTDAPLDDPNSPPSKSADRVRVKASIENWKRRLLDLTKRNRALNFRMNKVSTIAIVDEQPAEVFRQLYLRERAMRFKAAAEGEKQVDLVGDSKLESVAASETPSAVVQTRSLPFVSANAISSEIESVIEPEDEGESLGQEFAPYDAASLDEKYTDDWLQTGSKPEMLDKSLRRVDEQARATIEEQGVNTLYLSLGMLHYTESADSKQIFKAPVILLPVQLKRSSARSGYQILASGEDPLVNPALTEFLRSNFGMTMPELPDSQSMPEDYNLQSIFSAVSQMVKGRQDWTITTDIYLGLFSFQKLVMYKDLETHSEVFSEHRLIKQVVLHTGSQVAGLPQDVREMQLDQEFAPEATYQVVDADSSQLRAIAACARNYDLVIEGPPGTGKSQTITNLIAQALALGKSVLFVAEKMAALEVVHNRLVQAGLGDSCLELHSTKANKRTVTTEIARALDASLQGIAAPTTSTQRIPHVRATLSDYVSAVHTPFGLLGISPYRAYGDLGKVIDAPKFNYSGAADAVTFDQLEQTIRDLEDLAATSAPIGVPANHPWRDATKTFYTEQNLDEIKDVCSTMIKHLAELIESSAHVQEKFSLPPINDLSDINVATEIASVIKQSPGAPFAVLSSDAWNSPPAQALELIGKGRACVTLKSKLAAQLSDEALQQNHAEDISYVEQKSEGIFSFLAFLDGRYRSIKKRWLSYRLQSYQPSLIDQASEMKQVDRYRDLRSGLSQVERLGTELFGTLWRGVDSSWDDLDRYIKWVVEIRALCVNHSLDDGALKVASRANPDTSDVEQLKAKATNVSNDLESLRKAVGWPGDYFGLASLTDIKARIERLLANVQLGPQWAAFEGARQVVAQGLAAELIPAVLKGDLSFEDLPRTFLRSFYMKWLATVVQERSALARFSTLTHEQRVSEFKQLDQRVLFENRAALVSQLRDRTQHQLQQPHINECLPHLKREMARQRRHSPLRRTMKQAGEAIRVIKPCFMMSPLTVAQLLDATNSNFDLVIFDEASQLPPEDAVGAIARGSQLVVVGDPKQLPPTNFFQVTSGQANVQVDDEGNPLYEDSESILENFMAAGAANSRLKWHYRSTHESLINFSNVSFYDKDLYTFPSVETDSQKAGLQFEYVADGMYEGKGLNQNEARRVADAVVRFAKEQNERVQRGKPALSLGVGTFNLRQQLAIQDELEFRRRQETSIEPFFSRERVEPFFVKNLENIQGDERDVIYLSVTYARAADGKLRYNFGPLNSENGWRRLNVITTRARQCMRVFTSMKGDEINLAATASLGPRLLREFLLYAEHGRLESTIADATSKTDSDFEIDVMNELTRHSITVVPQVGVAGYRIDLGVLDDATPGRFLCGIECDGVAYHNSETARDRDRLRQQVLEARGWTIFRVWSTDWFKDRQGQVARLISFIEATRSLAFEEAQAEKETRERVARDTETQLAEESALLRQEAAELSAAALNSEPYQRPVAVPYVTTTAGGYYLNAPLLAAPLGDLVKACVLVIETESPIHQVDLAARVAAMWGQRAGPRIQSRIVEACQSAQNRGVIQRRGDFFWSISTPVKLPVRSRFGTKIPANRVAPEEYREAITLILAKGHAFSRHELVKEVRAVFGFNRTGALLDEAINREVDFLLQTGKVGEGSTGIRLRT